MGHFTSLPSSLVLPLPPPYTPRSSFYLRWVWYPILPGEVLLILSPIPCSHHVAIFLPFSQQYSVPPLRQRLLYRNHHCCQYGVGNPPTQTSSEAQWPADFRGSGLGCWCWGPLTLQYFGSISVSGPQSGPVGPSGCRGGVIIWWVVFVFHQWPRRLSRSAHESEFSQCSRPEVGSGRLWPLPPRASPSALVCSSKHTMLYPILFHQYALSGMFIFVRIIRQKPPIFDNADFHIYFSRELTILWFKKTLSK